jgi:hypothetical protein
MMFRVTIGAARYTSPQARVEAEFAVLAFSAIFLEKLGLPIAEGSIGLPVLVLWGVLLRRFVQGAATIDPLRAGLFASLLCTIMLSLFIEQELVSLPALLIFLGMYGTMLFRVDVDRSMMLRCMNKYQAGMIWIAYIVIGQQLIQYTIGSNYWLNLNKIIPSPLLVGGYEYLRPYRWNSPYLTPNGIFFLEPSGVSWSLALALAAEIIWFKRIKRFGIFALALLTCMAGTGITIIALFAPPLLIKMDRQLLKWTITLGAPLLLTAAACGAFSQLLDRSAEFSKVNSSGYGRMVLPFESTLTLATNPSYLINGNGPGTSLKGTQVQWPANKLIFEYGLMTAIVFHIFLLVTVLRHSASTTLAMIVLIPHLFFGGGFVTHTNIMMLVLFGSFLRLRPDASVLPVSSRSKSLHDNIHGIDRRQLLASGSNLEDEMPCH